MGVPYSNNNNTPRRNSKVGLPDPQGNDGKANVATTGPSKMVQDMAAQNFALRNGGQLPPSNAGVSTNPTVRHPDGTNTNPPSPMGVSPQNQIIGRLEAQRPVIRSGNGTTADGAGAFVQGSVPVATQKQWPMGNDNQGGQPVVRHPDGSVANTQVQSPYTADMANKTAQPQTNFENMQQQPTGWNPDGSPSYNSLSEALNRTSGQPQQNPKANFQADPSQRDGGFFGWLKGLMPKKRPGRREGETDDEYDARRTRNMQMVATFADAIRHMGNIVNTSKGAPLQVFNDPTTMLEQGRQTRAAARRKQEAADADAAYKASQSSIKEAAQKANEAYKIALLGYKDAADKRAAQSAADKKEFKDDYFAWQKENEAKRQQRQADQDKQRQDNWEKQFKFKQQQAAISNSLRQQSINKRGSGSGGRGGGSSASYSLYNPTTGKTEYFKNNNEFLRRAGELGYDTSKPVSESTSQEVITKDGVKKVTNTKRGTSVNAKIGQQEAQKKKQNANKGARSGSKLKNTSALGL